MAGKSKTLQLTQSPTSILTNSENGEVAKVLTLVASNTTSSDVQITVDIYRGGESYKIIKEGVIPGNKSLSVFLSKDFGIFLEEGDQLRMFASASGVEAICSYETVSA